MTASLLTKSALMGAFLFLGLLSVYEGAVPDLSWWLEAPLLGLTLVVIAPVLEEWTFREDGCSIRCALTLIGMIGPRWLNFRLFHSITSRLLRCSSVYIS